jgi:2-oxoisovalerate dehydrogenase E1 component alpha subunit
MSWFDLISLFAQLDKELCLKIYHKMVTLQIMDSIFYEAQRQGRNSFYLTTMGEEAINIASAVSLDDSDVVFSQVRILSVFSFASFMISNVYT